MRLAFLLLVFVFLVGADMGDPCRPFGSITGGIMPNLPALPVQPRWPREELVNFYATRLWKSFYGHGGSSGRLRRGVWFIARVSNVAVPHTCENSSPAFC